MIGDSGLLAFRQEYYGLLVSLLWREPGAELITALGQGIEDRIRGARGLNSLMGEGWEAIKCFLDATPPQRLDETVAEEYTRLFVGPQEPDIQPYESYYLTGRLLDRPLASLRGYLQEIGIAKQEGYPEPEDSLAFELEVMRRLIARQRSAKDPADATLRITTQAAFLRQHLLVWAPTAAADLARAERAVFYRGVAMLLQGFLEFERDLFKEWGAGEVRSLQEARESLRGKGEWHGPLFDVSGAGPVDCPTTSE